MSGSEKIEKSPPSPSRSTAPRVRLADVAQRANVSVASVSRVVRGLPNVEAATRHKVELALAELEIDSTYFVEKQPVAAGYEFVALYIRDMLNPFYALLVKGIQDVAATHKYGVVLSDPSEEGVDQYEKIKQLVRFHNVKGLIFVSLEFSPSLIESLLGDKIPLILVDNDSNVPQACSVTSDNRGGACSAVRYLISLGHRKILYLAGDRRLSTENERYAGYCEALSSAGIPIDPNLRADGLYDWQKAHDSIASKIESRTEFSAIFAANDLMAFAAKQALEEHNLSVPQDVSLMGFGDIPFSTPLSLTTYSLPAYEMGRNAMSTLVDLINGRMVQPKHLVLHPTIRIRNSCKRVEGTSEDTVRKIATGQSIWVGFTPPTNSEFYDIIQHGAYTMMRELTDRFGVKFKFKTAAPSEHQAIQSQVSIIEYWAARNFDALLVCSAGDFATTNALCEKVMSMGTAVYLVNMPAELWKESDLKAISAIGYDNHYQAGYLVGQYAAEKLNGKGKILLVWGIPGHWATSRKNGFLEAIAQFPGLQVVGEKRGDYVRDKGRQAAEALLKAHPDADLVYGENEEMALGAVEAVEAQGLHLWDGKKGILVIGADGLKSGYQSIRAGKLTATVNVGAVDQGREFIMSVFMHEVLGYNVDKIINVPTTIVDRTNVDVAEAYLDWALGTTY